jgi:hypothetical protein
MSGYSRLLTYLSLTCIAALATATSAIADETFSPTAAVSLPTPQKVKSFDISFVDPLIGLYVLGDRTNLAVDVIDTGTNTFLTQLKGGFRGAVTGDNDHSGPDGVLIVGHREVWVGDAPCPAGQPNGCDPVGPSSVKVIDLFTQQRTHVISTGGTARADELCVDPRDHLVMVANNADTPPFASLISTQTYQVVKKIPFDGTGGAPLSINGAEQCQWDHRTGKFYISIPGIGQTPPLPAGTGGVAVIDPVSMSVEQTFIVPLASCDSPQGMAIGPDHQILLGCNGPGGSNHPTAVIDDRNGKVIRTVDNESGSDEVWFNEGDGHYFLARSSAVGTNQLLGVIDSESPGVKGGEQPGGDIKADPDVVTATNKANGNAHSVAADAFMNQVYVPIPGGSSGICGSLGGNDANGCIAVFTAPTQDRKVAGDTH